MKHGMKRRFHAGNSDDAEGSSWYFLTRKAAMLAAYVESPISLPDI